MKETLEKIPKEDTVKVLKNKIERLSQDIKDLKEDPDLKYYFELEEKLQGVKTNREYEKIIKEMELLLLEKKLKFKKEENEVQAKYIDDVIKEAKKWEINLERLQRELELKETQEKIDSLIWEAEKLKEKIESDYQKLLKLEKGTENDAQIEEIEKQITQKEEKFTGVKEEIKSIEKKLKELVDKEEDYLEKIIRGGMAGALAYGKDILIEKEKKLIREMTKEFEATKEKIERL